MTSSSSSSCSSSSPQLPRAAYARLDRRTYTMLVSACERAGQWRRALAIMEDMRERGIQFYANPILDGLFAQGVKVWSAAAPLAEEEDANGNDQQQLGSYLELLVSPDEPLC